MTPIVFDIETGPASLEFIKSVAEQYTPPAHPGTFDPRSVKLGNMKDQEKIAAKIEDARQAHQRAVENYEQTVKAGEEQHWQEIVEKAALSAVTGQVLAIGYRGQKVVTHCQGDGQAEPDLLARFWSQFQSCLTAGRKLVGFNCHGFDIPFLVQRSWILQVSVPSSVFTANGYIESTFVDLMKVWCCGNRQSYSSLDAVCRACGIGAKPDDVDGAMFHKLFAVPETRGKAIEYLVNDLDMTWKLAERLGV